MAERPFTGLTAKLEITIGEGTSEVLGYISGFDLNLEKDIIEIISFTAEYKEKVPSIKDWSASCDGTYAMTEDSSQAKLLQAFEDSTKIKITTFLDDTNKFEGNAYVQSLSISSAPDDKTSISAEFAGTGAVVSSLTASEEEEETPVNP